ncbi:MAG: MBL fold metallo-hydrolase [Pikeienuella sp.]
MSAATDAAQSVRGERERLAQGLRYPFEDRIPDHGEAIEVADGILWMRLPLPMTLDHVNIYALDDGASWTIIDTGFSTSKTRQIWEQLLAGPLAGKPVGRVIGTHHHPDHIGLAGWFQDRGAAFWTTRTAYFYCRALQLDHHDTVSETNITHMRRSGASEEVIEAAIARGPWNFSQVTEPLRPGFKRLKEDDIIEMGGRRWLVIMGDGHAPEHATFWCEDEDIVITGDQILPRISPNLGVYPTEPDADPVGEWLVSCEKLQPHANETHLALPGHNRPFTGVPKRLEQLIENHHGALKRLRKVLTSPKTAVDCFDAIYKRPIKSGEFGLAMAEAVAHLNHMYAEGEATRRLDADGAYRFQLR